MPSKWRFAWFGQTVHDFPDPFNGLCCFFRKQLFSPG
jgi:hypothetical protein